MADDWFEQNAPAQDDWFSANAPKAQGSAPPVPLGDQPASVMGVAKTMGQQALDFLSGAHAGAMSTGRNVEDLIRQHVLGLPSVLQRPDVVQGMSPPPSFAGSLGKGAEQAAEFFLPEGLVGKGVQAAEAASAGTKFAKAAPYLARVLGEGASAAGIQAAHGGTPGEVALPGAMGAAPSALAPVGKYVIRGVSDLLGKSTGAGGEAVRVAASDTSKAFQDAMRNKTNELDIVSDLKDAVQTVKQAKGAEYRQALAQISQNTQPLDLTPVKQELGAQLQKFNIKAVPPPPVPPPALGGATPAQLKMLVTAKNADAIAYSQALNRYNATYKGMKPGDLDFSRSTIGNPSAQKEVRGAVKDIMSWGSNPDDVTPLGVDTLKRRIRDLYSDSSNARAFIKGMDAPITSLLDANVPGYKQMTSKYAEASDFLDAVTSELKANAKNPGDTIRSLTYSLNQNHEYRKILLETLDAAAGSNLKGTMAGYSLRGITPRGLAGVGAGISWPSLVALSAYFHNPALLAPTAISSPRFVGETVALISKLRRAAPAISAGPALAAGTSALIGPPSAPPMPPPPPAQ